MRITELLCFFWLKFDILTDILEFGPKISIPALFVRFWSKKSAKKRIISGEL